MRKTNFYAKSSEVKRSLFLNKPMIVLLYKRHIFILTNLTLLCLVLLSLFYRNSKMSTPEEISKGLPPI